MKPSVSPFSIARDTSSMAILPISARRPLVAHLRLGHAGTAQRRIGVQRIGGNAIADAPLLAIEQIGGDDLVIVLGCVGERAAAVAIAQRPDAGDVGAQLVIHLDVSALVVALRRLCPDRDRPCSADARSRAASASHGSPNRPRQSTVMTYRCLPCGRRYISHSAEPRSPSLVRNPAIACDTSSSSRGSGAARISTIVTSLPKRRYI